MDRYQGRLLAFAQGRVSNTAEAEDTVQETFIAFLEGLVKYRGQASIETYLFTILRRKIIDHFRGRQMNVCQIQDAKVTSPDGRKVLREIPAPNHTASWYVRKDEKHDLQQEALAKAIRDLVKGYRTSLNLRDLEVFELIFYCQLRNKDIAEIVELSEKQVALIKHRSLNRIREQVAKALPVEQLSPASDAMLTEIWETQRLSCPKRSTIGAFLLGTLEPDWYQYAEFHLNKLGCRFCQANLDDLQRQSTGTNRQLMHDRIMQSTVGFLRHS